MIRAIAVASDSSDLVGTVELSCELDGLAIRFVRASAWSADYVPTPPAAGRAACVPYHAIAEAWDDGETLRLRIDAPHIPYKRLVLAHFTRDRAVDHGVLHRERRKAELVIGVTAAALVAIVTALAGPSPLLAALATFVAIVLAIIGAPAAGRRIMLGGIDATAERRAFFHEIRRHLPTGRVIDDAGPALGSIGTALARGPLARAPATSEGRFSDLAPTLIGVGGSALLALGALAIGQGVVSDPKSPPPTREPAAQAQAIAPPPPAIREPAPPPEPPRETCQCQAPLSPAIPTRVPRISVLSSVVRERLDPKRPSLTVEVAAINNAAAPSGEIKGQVLFTVPGTKPGDPPRVRNERGVFYEGPLAPGAAIKWRVSGRGSSYTVDLGEQPFEDDASLAPPDAFAKLLSARTRSVRIHGATMLARMRDERAPAAIERLRAEAHDAEALRLEALARAAAPVYGCDLSLVRQPTGAVTASACVMNSSEEESAPLDARLVGATGPSTGDEPAPEIAARIGRSLRIPARTGVRVSAEAALPQLDGMAWELVIEPASP
jgi:hypothetical protein